MNERYFACQSCHKYTNAGYRHCYWTLEAPGIVERKKSVNVVAVLATAGYWCEEDGAELIGLSEIRLFLQQHQDHDLIFAEDEDIPAVPMFDGDWRMFDWLDTSPGIPDVSPRYLFERLGLQTWEQVTEWVARNDEFPWWWNEPTIMPAAEAKFISLALKS